MKFCIQLISVLTTLASGFIHSANATMPLNFYFNHSYSDPYYDILDNLPVVFNSFTGTRPALPISISPPWDSNIHKLQTVNKNPQIHSLRMRYLNSSIAYEEQQSDIDYPVKYTDPALGDESAFVHSTDPAILQVISLGNSIELVWNLDQRIKNLKPNGYVIYKRITTNNSGLWSRLAKLNSQTNNYLDLSFPKSATSFCYQLKSIDQYGSENIFSSPVCTDVTAKPNQPMAKVASKAMFDPSYFTKLIATAQATPCPGPNDKSLKVTYMIEAQIHQGAIPINAVSIIPFSFYKPGAVQIGNQFYEGPGEQYISSLDTRESDPTKEDFQKPIVETSPIRLKSSGKNLFVGTVDMYMPVLKTPDYNKAFCKPTEGIVFRVEGLTNSGKVLFPPSYGKNRLGYITTRINNRIRQRQWMGYWMNPNSTAWAKALASASTDAVNTAGYNGIFLDELRPLQASIVSPNGAAAEAPFFEFDYPVPKAKPWDPLYGSTGNPGFFDPWTRALGNLIQHLHTISPSTKFIGNTLKFYDGYNSNQDASFLNQMTMEVANAPSTSSPDGVMLENCLSDGNKFNIISGPLWLGQVDALDLVTSLGKTVICLATPDFTQTATHDLAQNRIYILASALLVKYSATKLHLGYNEIDPSHAKSGTAVTQLNDFPEFHVQLGGAVSDRIPSVVNKSLRTLPLFYRYFKNGIVVVNPNNPDPASSNGGVHLTFKSPKPVSRLEINGVDLNDTAYTETNPARSWTAGFLSYDKLSRSIDLNPGEAAILIYAQNSPHSTTLPILATPAD